MTLSHLAGALLFLPLLVGPESRPLSESPGAPQHVTVMITSSGYDPATVTVRHGDLVRFVQMDVLAHNIEFHRAPDGASMAPRYQATVSNIEVLRAISPTARVGPFLIGEGRTYEIRIGEDMPEGDYEFGCSRHTKWRGLMVVEDAEALP